MTKQHYTVQFRTSSGSCQLLVGIRLSGSCQLLFSILHSTVALFCMLLTWRRTKPRSCNMVSALHDLHKDTPGGHWV
jgi:hypothetical protein